MLLQSGRELRGSHGRHNTQPSAGAFDFLALPPELRNEIYRLLLTKDGESIEINASRGPCSGMWAVRPQTPFHHPRQDSRSRPFTNLLAVSKQINNEAASILYGENNFVFSTTNGTDNGDRTFLGLIGTSNRHLMRHVELRWYREWMVSLEANLGLMPKLNQLEAPPPHDPDIRGLSLRNRRG